MNLQQHTATYSTALLHCSNIPTIQLDHKSTITFSKQFVNQSIITKMKASVEGRSHRLAVLAWLGVSFGVGVVGDLYLHHGYFKYDYDNYATTKEIFLLFFVLKTVMLALQYRNYMQSWYVSTNMMVRTIIVMILLTFFLLSLMNLYLSANHLMTLSTFPLMIWRVCESSLLILQVEKCMMMLMIHVFFAKTQHYFLLPTNAHNAHSTQGNKDQLTDGNTTHNTNTTTHNEHREISYDYNTTFSHKDIYLSLVEVFFGLIEIALLGMYFYFAKTYYGMPWTKFCDLFFAIVTLVQNARQLPRGLYVTIKPREDKEL